MGPAEIAGRLGWSRAELRACGAQWPAQGRALERARDGALAWWEARARLWASEGRANATLWSKAMAGRFGEDGYGPARRTSARDDGRPAPRREISARDRAKAVRLLLAEAGPATTAEDGA
jgi:hypothetical protein